MGNEFVKATGTIKGKRQLGIYVHIPFCISKCIYCDFLSFPATEETKGRYVKALCREIKAAGEELKGKGMEASTVFFGGGTPSVLLSAQIVEIMNAIRDSFTVTDNAEITMECNPGTLTREKLNTYRFAGINRLSLGLQSPDNRELKNLGRIHTYEQFEESYIAARLAGFDNINIDLMAAIPYQKVEGYRKNLWRVAALKPEHISAYSLILEEGTALYNIVRRSKNRILPTEDEDRQMYSLTKEILAEEGYKRYEISNYAREGHECRHNCIYWERGDYIGFGLAAASLMNEVRFTNTSDMASYLAAPVHNRAEEQTLTKQDAMAEYMFLGLRMMKGVDKGEFEKRFGESFDVVYGDTAKEHIAKGLMVSEGSRLYLTDIGIDISNTVMADYIL